MVLCAPDLGQIEEKYEKSAERREGVVGMVAVVCSEILKGFKVSGVFVSWREGCVFCVWVSACM